MNRPSNRGRAYSYAPFKRTAPARSRDLYRDVRRMAVLVNAWKRVRENGLASKRPQTVDEIKAFDRESHRLLPSIQSHLQKNRFAFAPQVGVLLPRPGKKPRPIVIAAVTNRIVQRAILDVLQTTDEICELLTTPTSFGGIAERGRENALALAYREIGSGRARYCLRSDIKDFGSSVESVG